jgi:complex iron-sulfur molybdoenzyme family reductase subunit beta
MEDRRIPVEVLAKLFGDSADQTPDQRIVRIEEIFDIIQRERDKVAAGGNSELVDILIARRETDRFQV